MKLKHEPAPDAVKALLLATAHRLPHAAEVFAEALRGPADVRPLFSAELHVLEQDADEAYIEFLVKVSDTFMTPYDREDLYQLAEILDDIVDTLDHVVDLTKTFGLGEIPKSIVRMSEEIVAMTRLDDVATGQITDPENGRVTWLELSVRGNTVSALYRETLADLLSGKYPPREALKLKVIADRCDRIGELLLRYMQTLVLVAIKEI